MKNIKLYESPKYLEKGYKEVSEGIYKKDKEFFMSISFEQEPKLDEGKDSTEISQYPLEDILDRFFVHVSDFYEEINSKKKKECYIELSSSKKDNLEKARIIVGKHVYNKNIIQNGEEVVDLVIE